MDYIYLAQTLIPVIIITIAAKCIISSSDKQIATLIALNNHQEKDIARLKNIIDVYEGTLVDINSMNHPKHPRSFNKVQSEYDYKSADDIW